MIDSHCHLDAASFADDLSAVLERAREAGVRQMICIGSGNDLGSARSAVALAARRPEVYATVGIHPHDVARMTQLDWTALDELVLAPRVVGVGETGLDYHYDHSPREVQKVAFRRFVNLARAARQPVISHVRDAHTDAVTILREERAAEVGGVIHCFSGGVDDARKYLDIGHFLSFSGILTFKNADDIRAAALFAPLERILVETDAPYLAPIPHRGRRNEPAYVAHTLEALAVIRGISVGEANRVTTENTRRLFTLGDGDDTPLHSG
jgi:TatD DNase family protein